MKKITSISLNSYEYRMNFNTHSIEHFKLDLLTILYLSSINELNNTEKEAITLTKRVKRLFLYLDVLINHNDTRSNEEKKSFREALFDELSELREVYIDFDIKDIDLLEINEWLQTQK